MLKKIFETMCLVVMGVTVSAQSIADARTLIYHERYTSAETMMHDILKIEMNNPEAWYTLGQAYLAENKISELKDTLAKAPAAISSQPLIQCLSGQILMKQNNTAAAAPFFETALKDTKMKDAGVLAAVAAAHIDSKTGDANYAIELLKKAIKRDKKNPALEVLMGDAYRKVIDGGNAFKSYQQALIKDPNYAVANYKIGKIFTSQNNPESYLKYFSMAVAADPKYAPALYELYYHYYFQDIKLSEKYLDEYISASDKDIRNEYLKIDMLYASKNYDQAIQQAENLMAKEGDKIQPRIYKLIAYSLKEKGDFEKGAGYMHNYFAMQSDTGLVAKDFEAMGDMYLTAEGKEDSAALYYEKGVALEKDTAAKIGYYKKIAGLYKKVKDYNNEATWLGKYYNENPTASNVDLFNWGLANYLGKDYVAADSVFTYYGEKFPTEEYGFYWSARANAAIDTAMEKGLAIPHYIKLIDLLEQDTTNNATVKKHLIEAYGYIAAYKANTEKDYEAAITYFEKVIALDPENDDAKRYVDILKKNLAKGSSGQTSR